MECASLASALPAASGADAGAPGCHADVQRFEDALNRPDGGDVYVDGSASATTDNPLVGIMNTFDSLKLSPDSTHRTSSAEHSDPDYDEQGEPHHEQVDQFTEFSEVLLGVQSQILRTTLMMETLNTAKQGVTTLFQQQG